MRIVVLNPSDFRHWTLYVKGCGPWTDTATPRTDRPVRFNYRRTTVWCAPRKRFESVTHHA